MLYDDRDKMFADSTVQAIEEAALDTGFSSSQISVVNNMGTGIPNYALILQRSGLVGSDFSSFVGRGNLGELEEVAGGVEYAVATDEESAADALSVHLDDGSAMVFFYNGE